jgi:hypothetical protein
MNMQIYLIFSEFTSRPLSLLAFDDVDVQDVNN